MPLHLLVKWEVVSPNSRWGQLESISIISSIPLLWFCISNVGWFGGGGGCNVFLTFYAISNIPNSRWGQLESISIISSVPLFWFCISNVGWFGGGGGCNVFLTFYAISNISRTKIWEYKPIISHLMFSSCFFGMLEILKSAPSLKATG